MEAMAYGGAYTERKYRPRRSYRCEIVTAFASRQDMDQRKAKNTFGELLFGKRKKRKLVKDQAIVGRMTLLSRRKI